MDLIAEEKTAVRHELDADRISVPIMALAFLFSR